MSASTVESPREPSGLTAALEQLTATKDVQAWATLLMQAGPDIQRVAMRLAGDPVLAEDAVQETLMLVRNHAARFDAHSGDADADARRWILSVAANASLQLLRRQRRKGGRDRRAGQLLVQTVSASADPAERTERHDEGQLLRRKLAALPAAYGQER